MKKIIQHNFLQIIKMDLQSKKVSDEMKVDLCTKYFVVIFLSISFYILATRDRGDIRVPKVFNNVFLLVVLTTLGTF